MCSRRYPSAAGVATALLLVAGCAPAEQVTFRFVPTDDIVAPSSVSVRGNFNEWVETPMELQNDGSWAVTVDLKPGEYEYKYFIDGQWPKDMATWLSGAPADPGADGYSDDGYGGQNALRSVGVGSAADVGELFPNAPELPEGYARIHYHRPRSGYTGWGLHVWGDADEVVTWTSPMPPTGRDGYGLYWDIRLTDGAEKIDFIIHKGDSKDPGPDMFVDLAGRGREIWLVSGRTDIHESPPDISLLALGDLSRHRAHWVDARTIAWGAPIREGHVYRLHHVRHAGLALSPDGVTGGESLPLEVDPGGLPPDVRQRFPHLGGLAALRLADSDLDRVSGLLKGQIAVSVSDRNGRLLDATGIQIPGVLDDLFAYEGPLGIEWDGQGVPTLSVWAPTALAVRVHLFDSSDAPEAGAVLDMLEENGVWSLIGGADWKHKYYLYEVEVYVPITGATERNMVTDPYSRSLSVNSTRSQIVDLNDSQLKPDGWDALLKPPLDAPEDIVIYELHVRDFSASDPTVPEDDVGTFKAFASNSDGAKHLAVLAEAGLTHIHLLPAFDIATINEDKSTWQDPGELSLYPSDSEEQQNAVAGVRDSDGYNWGYDPFHYGVPEGSYSTDPDGPARIIEFRQMVKSLSDMGLRVVMDVVYNHTHASGIEDRAVLDKIVPGYYHRLNSDGFVETSTCCQNTATEHAMMERLMVDDLVHWAIDYKVDGFRFDLMGHHMKRNMLKVREALAALTPEEHGVDGSSIYIYGEGWDFGEVQGGRRGANAGQMNMAGTGIGTFNDRMRDASRGGSPFGDRRDQGFITGLYYDPSGFNRGGDEERGRLLHQTDRIRVGLAGGLRDYPLTDYAGNRTLGGQSDNGGYTSEPREAISYISAHDNETLFDKIQYAAPGTAGLSARVRMQNMGVSLIAFSEGVPFFHAGVDMLRSKSMEADSYNAGDWFNKLDWSYSSNNFGVGLPSAEKNRDRWDIIRPLLARADITPGRPEIVAAVEHFREVLRVRRSSPLFRLRTAEDIKARVRFHNTGPSQTPGLIAMSLSDDVDGLPSIDPSHRRIVVVFNARLEDAAITDEDWVGGAFTLHPIQSESHDDVVRTASFNGASGTFTVPPRTAAVFIEK